MRRWRRRRCVRSARESARAGPGCGGWRCSTGAAGSRWVSRACSSPRRRRTARRRSRPAGTRTTGSGRRVASARDATVVRRLGERFGVPVEVVAVTGERRGSLEAAARAARYAALTTCADRVGATRIALGHTADDQAETVLMRVLQGTGMRGLAGIPPVRDRIIRPLIECRHADLVAEVRRAGLEWVEDPANQDRK